MTAREELTILRNIMARSGDMGEVDLQSELSKALAGINAMNSQEELMNMQRMAELSQNQPVQPLSPEQGMNVPQDGMNPAKGLNMP